MRLDKYLSQMGEGTRSEVKKYIRSGRVLINESPVNQPETKILPGKDRIVLDGKEIGYQRFEYFMLNKPAGYVSATRDMEHPTVTSLIKESRRQDLFPVGRLDIDTEGLLLITNDGELSHRLLSPRNHVPKTYLVHAKGKPEEETIRMLEQGMDIGDEKPTAPARAVLIKTDDDNSYKGISVWVELTIREGRYHQVKRMMAAAGHPVLYLKRIAMGGLPLDNNLALGEYRMLTEKEIELLQRAAQKGDPNRA